MPASFDPSGGRTCHVPGVPLEAGLGLSGDLDPGAAAVGVQREFSLSGAVLLILLLMTVAEKSGNGKQTAKYEAYIYDVLPLSWVLYYQRRYEHI